jgi:hypothetical protein
MSVAAILLDHHSCLRVDPTRESSVVYTGVRSTAAFRFEPTGCSSDAAIRAPICHQPCLAIQRVCTVRYLS